MKPVLAELGCDRLTLAAAIVACVSALRPLATEEQYTLDLIVLLAVKILVGGDINIDSAQNGMLAVTITREIEARADELRHDGVRDPVARALKEAAERYQHASGPALNRWLRRWRARNR